MALVIITLNIFLTNVFLNNEFLAYSLNVIKSGSQYQDRIFPKMSKCSFYRYWIFHYSWYYEKKLDTDRLVLWPISTSCAFSLSTSSTRRYTWDSPSGKGQIIEVVDWRRHFVWGFYLSLLVLSCPSPTGVSTGPPPPSVSSTSRAMSG